MHQHLQGSIAVLMSQAAHRRVRGRLDSLGLSLRAVLVDDQGRMTCAGREVTAVEADASIAWAGSELFIDGQFPALVRLALQMPELRWFQSGAAGVDDPAFARILERGARLTACHAPSEAVADFVIAGVLDHFQRGPERRDARTRQQWIPLPFREVAGTHWLVVGFGAIGQAVSRRARGFGARITAVRRRPGKHDLAESVVGAASLHASLEDADVVVLAVPLVQQTANLVDAAFIGRMKAGSILINVSRGAVVDEAALLQGLTAGRPEHAVLDVCSVEPPPPAHRFWTHPHIALTPHVAGMGSGLVGRSDDLFVENLRRFITGAPLLHEVAAGAGVRGGALPPNCR